MKQAKNDNNSTYSKTHKKFVLMMKPAVASTASIDMKVLILGFVETIIFFMIGWYLGKIKHYE